MCTVLVVDDNKMELKLNSNLLKKVSNNPKSIKFVYANNGVEALNYLYKSIEENYSIETPYPDLILLDYLMPEMNGEEFVYKFDEAIQRADLKTINVVFCTSSVDKDLSQPLKLEFVVDAVLKPLTKESAKMILKNYTECC